MATAAYELGRGRSLIDDLERREGREGHGRGGVAFDPLRLAARRDTIFESETRSRYTRPPPKRDDRVLLRLGSLGVAHHCVR